MDGGSNIIDLSVAFEMGTTHASQSHTRVSTTRPSRSNPTTCIGFSWAARFLSQVGFVSALRSTRRRLRSPQKLLDPPPPLSLSPSGAFVGNHREKPRNPLPAFPLFFSLLLRARVLLDLSDHHRVWWPIGCGSLPGNSAARAAIFIRLSTG